MYSGDRKTLSGGQHKLLNLKIFVKCQESIPTVTPDLSRGKLVDWSESLAINLQAYSV